MQAEWFGVGTSFRPGLDLTYPFLCCNPKTGGAVSSRDGESR